MLDLGLSRDDYAAYLQTLRSSHRIRISVRIHDRDEAVIGSLSSPINRVLSGAVQYDASADVTRSLDLTVLDPERKLRFEAGSPVQGAVFADRFVSIIYEVWVPAETSDLIGSGVYGVGEYGVGTYGGAGGVVNMDGDWVSCPVFWGPLTSYERVGAEVTLTAQGKEALLLAPHFVTDSYQLHRGVRLDDAIRRIAGEAGEHRFRLPDLDHRLQAAYPIPKQDEPWKVLAGGQRLRAKLTSKNAASDDISVSRGRLRDTTKQGLIHMAPGHQTIYYDGHGRLTVRRLATQKVLGFAWGRDLLSAPTVSYESLEEFRNHVEVTGKRFKSSSRNAATHDVTVVRAELGKGRAFARAELPNSHPLSPQAMARNGKPRYLTEFLDTELKTDAECQTRAREALKHLSEAGVNITFDCLPIPHLEENDRIELRTPEFSITVALRQWTLPLSATEPMSVGRHRQVRKFRRRHRNHWRH